MPNSTETQESEDAIQRLRKDYVPTTEAMQILNVSRTTLKNKIAAGEIQALKMGHSYMIPREELDRVKIMTREEAGRLGAQQRWERERARQVEELSKLPHAGIRTYEPPDRPAPSPDLGSLDIRCELAALRSELQAMLERIDGLIGQLEGNEPPAKG